MLTITDLFAGAGGSSSGAERVPGVRVRIAANHWNLAIETHAKNLPHADHDCADISQVDPRRYPATDILWASPECTAHSVARGKRRADRQPDLFDEVLPDEAAERSRATMWDVPRFIEAMTLRGKPYKAFVVENVVDVRKWMYYEPWKAALRAARYCLHEVYLNSMFADQLGDGAPQSRNRYYGLGHLKSITCPDLDKWTRPAAYCTTCDAVVAAVQAWKSPDRPWGQYRAQYVWRCPRVTCRNTEVFPPVLPAAAAIDWTLAGERIGDRARPLSEATMRRIEAGLRRYARPLLTPAGGTWNDTAYPVDDPMRTRTTRETEALVVPLRNNGVARPATRSPLMTIAAAGEHHALVMRNLTARGDQGQMLTPVGEPLRTLVASNVQSLVSWVYAYDTGAVRPVSQPLPTQTTVEGDALLAGSFQVEDCRFRMLEPHEIQAGMAFARDYTVLGNRRERVRQLGNAVTPPAARDLIAALAESLTGEDIPQTA